MSEGQGDSVRPANTDTADRDGPDAPPLDLDALQESLEQILDEGIAEALAEQRTGFEQEYSRLWDSRSFWRRVAVGEGTAIVACLLGGFFAWQLSR